MITSSIEITDKEYLIKLDRNEFNLSFISQLLKRIETEERFFNFKNQSICQEDDFRSRKADDPIHVRFDTLDEK